METYSPLAISTSTVASACVSTSSVENTLVTPSSLMTGGKSKLSTVGLLLKSNPIERVPCRHVRQNYLIAHAQPRQHFHGVHRALAKLDLRARGAARKQ